MFLAKTAGMFRQFTELGQFTASLVHGFFR